ncbi:MAG: alpha/beta hydrolase [Bifidobacteriaceae bacterium]|jgi:pimeloyl-ACP methyl ester carboxylesterase|nr:alpha/beta hydrolase [Bifidobacteriaceae bacterium]
MTVLAVRGAGSLKGSAPLVPASTTPLVLLHAFPLSSAMWVRVEAELPDLPILEIDLPGAGLSPTVEPVGIDSAARAVAASLGELGVTRAVIAGVSMGGYVAMSLLRQVPELFAGVALMHTKATVDTPEVRAGRLATAREVLRTGSVASLRPMASKLISAESAAADPGLAPQLERWILEATPAGVAWAAQAMAGRADSLAALRTFGTEALVVAGEADPFTSVAEAEEMMDALGWDAVFALFAGVGHLSPLEAPNALARTLRGFYRSAIG